MNPLPKESLRLKKEVEQKIRRLEKAKKEGTSLLGQTVYLGVLGLLLVLPVVGGAYLGQWLDELSEGYSIRWTLSLIVLGLGLGIINVYLFIRE